MQTHKQHVQCVWERLDERILSAAVSAVNLCHSTRLFITCFLSCFASMCFALFFDLICRLWLCYHFVITLNVMRQPWELWDGRHDCGVSVSSIGPISFRGNIFSLNFTPLRCLKWTNSNSDAESHLDGQVWMWEANYKALNKSAIHGKKITKLEGTVDGFRSALGAWLRSDKLW